MKNVLFMNKQQKIYQELELDYTQRYSQKVLKRSSYNLQRVEKLINLVKQAPHKSILEIGCGERYVTQELRKLSRDVTSIEVTQSAITLAKRQNPNSTFILSSLENFKSQKKYDLVVCSEVLNYILDRNYALDKLRTLGKYLVTSSFIFNLPYGCLSNVIYEWKLPKRFTPIKREVHFNILEHRLCMLGLWKMNN